MNGHALAGQLALSLVTWTCQLVLRDHQPPNERTISPHAVLAAPSCIADGLDAVPADEQPTSLPIGGQVVHVYNTG